MKWWNQTKTFVSEVIAEMKKTYFPGQKEVVNTTVVVVITSIIFAVFLWASDMVIVWATRGIFDLAS